MLGLPDRSFAKMDEKKKADQANIALYKSNIFHGKCPGRRTAQLCYRLTGQFVKVSSFFLCYI